MNFQNTSNESNGYNGHISIPDDNSLHLSNQATFSFDYHMYGATSMGSLALQASDNNGASWTNVWSVVCS